MVKLGSTGSSEVKENEEKSKPKLLLTTTYKSD